MRATPTLLSSAPQTPAAYSNPASVLAHASAEGYAVADFALWPLPFGAYSSQPEVGAWRRRRRVHPLTRLKQPPPASHGPSDPADPPLPPPSAGPPPPPRKVRAWISSMKARGEAFYSEASGTYLLAGVLFERRATDGGGGGGGGRDLAPELLALLTALE
jgi:hypothetical protein